MKFVLPFLLFAFYVNMLVAEKQNFEEIRLLGVENPVSFTISPNGLKMIVIDRPKHSRPILKQLVRPYLESSWAAADELTNINKLIDIDTRIDAPCFSHDGNYFFFAANFKNSYGGMDIYYCQLNENKWSDPVNIGNAINSELNENSPSISGNNRNLIFTREVTIKKLEDFNCGELWLSEIDSTSQFWTTPKKVNTMINSGGIAYAKIYDDNITILYSKIVDDNKRWQIHWVKRLGDIHWYIPIAIDTLNSKESEICPVFCKRDQYIYFLINKGRDAKPECNMFRFKLTPNFYPEKTITIKGTVKNQIDNLPVKANLLVKDPVLGRIKFFTQSDEKTGEWSMILNASEALMFHVWQNDYSHQYQLFTQKQTQNNFDFNFKLFNKANITLNIYDREELWPLDAEISIKSSQGNSFGIDVNSVFQGKKRMTLPIGSDYQIMVSMKDYFSNELNLALSNIILFDEFVRDIELEPVKRELEIFVNDEETSNPLEASIKIINKKRNYKLIPEMGKGKMGLYTATLREGEQFDIEVRGPQGYSFKHQEIDLNVDRELHRLNVSLQPLKKKVPIRLNNINFESNSADLMESSYEELNRVAQLIKDNSDIKVEIMAHTDDVGSDRYNNVLAEKRAESVVKFMILNGTESRRLISKGYGESMPLVPNDSEEHRAINRRVEMKILDLNDNVIDEIEK
jgi:outer membrane protein OmpA-like peptidoglycan-associated protein